MEEVCLKTRGTFLINQDVLFYIWFINNIHIWRKKWDFQLIQLKKHGIVQMVVVNGVENSL